MTTNLVPQVDEVFEKGVTLQQVAARRALMEGKIPLNAIKQHPGKGGKTFTYVSHIHGTKTMNDAHSEFWDIQTLDEKAWPDESVTARVQVTVFFYNMDGSLFHKRTVTQNGAKEKIDGMSFANRVLSAESRGLMRCMLRLYNYGAEFYKNEDEEELTTGGAWALLKEAAEKRKVPSEKLGAHFKAINFPKDMLVEKFADAWKECYDFCTLYLAEEKERKAAEDLAKKEARVEEERKKRETKAAAKVDQPAES